MRRARAENEMKKSIANGPQTAKRRAGVHLLLSPLPLFRPPGTPSISRAGVSRRTSSRSAHALRWHSWRARDARIDTLRVRPEREHRRAIFVSPVVPNGPVFCCEFHRPANRVHALWRGPRRNSRAWISSRHGRLRHGAEGLPQHRVATKKRQTAQRHVFACGLHALCDFRVQLRLKLDVAPANKDSWPHEADGQCFGQWPFRVEEAVRHLDFLLLAETSRNHAGPVMGRLDESSDGGVGERVIHLLEQIVVGDEQDDAGLMGGPKVFPTAERSVLGFCDELGEDLEKRRESPVGVGENPVPVIEHEAHRMQHHAGALGRERQALLNVFVGEPRRPEEELALRAAWHDEVAAPRQNSSRQGHRSASVKARNWL